MPDQLALYNAALREFGNRQLASLSESCEERRVLDSVYSDVLADCIEAGQWNFGVLTAVMHGDTGLAYTDTGGDIYGYRYGFAKPSTWIRTIGVAIDDHFSEPLIRYADEAGRWYADTDTLFVRYISSDSGTGLNMALWPRSFTRYVELELAARVCYRLGGGSKKEDIERDRDRAKLNAMNKDAMNEAQPKFLPTGSWNRARRAAYDNRKRGGL